jgi:hypothetical protein
MPFKALRSGAVLVWRVLASVLLAPLHRGGGGSGGGGGGSGADWTLPALSLLLPSPPPSEPAAAPAAAPRADAAVTVTTAASGPQAPPPPPAKAAAAAEQPTAAATPPPRSHRPPDWSATVAAPDFEGFLAAFNDGAGLAVAHAAAPELSNLAVSPWVPLPGGGHAAAATPTTTSTTTTSTPPPIPIPGGPPPGSPGCAPPPDPATPALRLMAFTPRGVRWLPLRVAAVGTNELRPRAPGQPAVMVGSAAVRWGGGRGTGSGKLTRLVTSTMVASPCEEGTPGVRLELWCAPTLPAWLGRVARPAIVQMSGAFAGRTAAWAAGAVGGRVVAAGKGARGGAVGGGE